MSPMKLLNNYYVGFLGLSQQIIETESSKTAETFSHCGVINIWYQGIGRAMFSWELRGMPFLWLFLAFGGFQESWVFLILQDLFLFHVYFSSLGEYAQVSFFLEGHHWCWISGLSLSDINSTSVYSAPIFTYLLFYIVFMKLRSIMKFVALNCPREKGRKWAQGFKYPS